MSFKVVFFIILIVCLRIGHGFSQTAELPKVKVKGVYDGTLDAFLKDLMHKYNIVIKYSAEDVEGMHLKQMFLEQDLSSVLEMIRSEYKLKYTVDSEGAIVLTTGKNQYKKVNVQQTQEEESQQRYAGEPKAKNVTVSGIIKDKETGEGLPYATIKIKGTKMGVQTNADGFFTLANVPSDTNTLLVNYMGFQMGVLYLNPETPRSNIAIEMSPMANQLSEVVVEGENASALKVPEEISVIKMNPKAVASLPNIGEKDVMRAMQLMPGVGASNESSSGLYVRGGTPDQNLVLYDGFTVYQVDHLYGFFSAFNYNALKDVQLYKGGYGSKYGGRLSSVTEITGKEGNSKKYNAGGDISLLSTNLFVEGPIGNKFTFLAAGRRSFKGPIYNKIFEEFNGPKQSTSGFGGGGSGGGGRRRGGNGGANSSSKISSYFYDVNTKLTFKPTLKDIFTWSVYNGTDKLDNSTSLGNSSRFSQSGGSFSANISDLTKYGNIGTSIKWSRKWSDRLYSNTLISYSNFYSVRTRANQSTLTTPSGDTRTFSTGIFENNDLKDYSFKSDYEWNLHKNHKIGFGVNATYYDIAYTYSQNDTSTILDRRTYGTLSTVYLEDKIKLFGSRMMVTPGIRSSYYNVTDQMYHEPRLAASYRLSEKLILKGATGLYYQMANQITREDILSGNKTFWVLSDKNKIPVSLSKQYVAGIAYETKNYLFSMEGYYKDLSNLTEYSLRFNTNRDGIGYNESFLHGSGFSRGIEWLAQRKFGKLTGWVSYTLGQVQNMYAVYSDNPYPGAQDVRNEFKMVGIYKMKRWTFSATWIYASGKPYTAPEGGYQLTLLNGSTRDFIAVGAKNANRFPDYHRMDLAANYLLFTGDEDEGEERREIGYIGISLFNAYNHTNVWYYDYQVVDNQVVSRAITYLGITPNVTLSIRIR